MSASGRLAGMSARNETAEAVRRGLEGKRDRASLVFEAFLVGSLLLSLAVLLWLLADIFLRSMPVWQVRGPIDFMTRNLSANPAKAGIAQGLMGSLILIVMVGILAIPTGIAAAVYLEEYAGDTFVTRTLNTVVRNLAGVPAVVYGILGLAVFVLIAEPFTGGRTLISGGLTLARAFGETAPLLLIGAAASTFSSPASASFLDRLTGTYTAMPTIIYGWAKLPQKEFKALTAAAIVVLLAVILIINAIAIILRNRYARKW